MSAAKNVFKTTCLRPRPETRAEFDVVFAERNKVYAAMAELQEAMFAAAGRNDVASYTAHQLALESMRAKEEALSRELRPLQFEAWSREDPNIVTNLGRNDILDKYWRGTGYTQTVAMGLKGTGAPAAGDTMVSHASWLEVGGANAPVYTGGRKAVTMGVAASQATVSPQQTFAMTSGGTVSGLFMVNGGSTTKDDTTGTLVSAVNFTGGDEVVIGGDSLLVTYTFNG